jgi:hypothetical protein
MNGTISPRLRKLLALSILFVLLWSALRLSASYVAARLDLASEIDELTVESADISARRIDLGKLQEELAALLASAPVKRSTIIAANDRDALGQLMQAARASLEKIQGTLLSLTEASMAKGGTMVAVQIRARLDETRIPRWLASVDAGNFSPRIEEFIVSAQHDTSTKQADLEVSAILRMSWVNQKAAAL